MSRRNYYNNEDAGDLAAMNAADASEYDDDAREEQPEKVYATHPFETAGLGIAPFRVLGVREANRGPMPVDGHPGMTVGSPGQCMDVCAFCGQSIAEVWMIGSSDGKRFTVGCKCVEKASAKLASAGHQDAVRLRRELKAKKDTARIEAMRETLDLDETQALLSSQPSPNEWRAKQGETALDWATWMMRNSGTSGRIKVCRFVDKAIKARS